MKATSEEQATISAETTIGAIVAADFRTAKVFEKHGIDFCCGGKVSLEAVCREKGLDPRLILEELAAVKGSSGGRSHNYDAWALPFLADYVINTHHAYLNDNTEQIAAYTRKIASVHGGNHPELHEIATLFAGIATDMTAHLREEEEVLFPAIRRIDNARQIGATPDTADLDTIREALAKLDHEHQEIGDAVHAIRRLAHDYAIPADACNTFVLTYEKLKEFEDDLHIHVHLENNILFPKAAQL